MTLFWLYGGVILGWAVSECIIELQDRGSLRRSGVLLATYLRETRMLRFIGVCASLIMGLLAGFYLGTFVHNRWASAVICTLGGILIGYVTRLFVETQRKGYVP